METKKLFGKPVAKHIKSEIDIKINQLFLKGITPGLAVIIVGDDAASKVYVKNKQRAFERMKCYSKVFKLDSTTRQKEVEKIISKLNVDQKFHGILVQLPLPSHLNTKRIIQMINPEKDVDGFHPENVGKLSIGIPLFVPCTPLGIIEMMKFYKIKVEGRHVVVIGRSDIVGKPIFSMLIQKMNYGNGTVTMCHSRTKKLSYHVKQADVIIAAVGVPNIITKDMIKKGADIIDVGINRVADNSERGYHLCGDVDFDSAIGIANTITPVPGGVGVMTITMLLHNTVLAASQA